MSFLGFTHLPGGFNDWRIGLGAVSSYGRGGVALLVAGAVVAVALAVWYRPEVENSAPLDVALMKMVL